MARTLSEVAFRAIQAEASGEVWCTFVVITHPDLEAPLRFVSGSDEPIAVPVEIRRAGRAEPSGSSDPAGGAGAGVETILASGLRQAGSSRPAGRRSAFYEPAPFSVALPADGTERLASVQVEIPTVDQYVLTTLRDYDTPPRVSVHLALASSPAFIEAGPYDMLVAGAEQTVTSTIVDLSYEDILNRPVVDYGYTPQRTPALHK